jgi:replicative DNA helicase Mcm
MTRISNLRRRVESLEDEIGVEPPESNVDSDGDDTDAFDMRVVVEFVENEGTDTRGASIETVLDVAVALGLERSKAEHELEKLRRRGEVYEPQSDYLRVT